MIERITLNTDIAEMFCFAKIIDSAENSQECELGAEQLPAEFRQCRPGLFWLTAENPKIFVSCAAKWRR